MHAYVAVQGYYRSSSCRDEKHCHVMCEIRDGEASDIHCVCCISRSTVRRWERFQRCNGWNLLDPSPWFLIPSWSFLQG